MYCCDVYIEETFLNNQKLTYRCTDATQKGTRVWVWLRGRKMVAFVVDTYPYVATDFDFELQHIGEAIDEAPIINDELYELAQHLSYTTLTPIIKCLQTILPNKLRPKTTSKKIKTERVLKLVNENLPLTPKQQAFVDAFRDVSRISLKDARRFYSNYRVLIEKGVYVEVEQEVIYQENSIAKSYPEHNLTQQQLEIVDAIKHHKAHTYLLHGVTGSGKTEVYLHLAKATIQEGKAVIFLVPEISLTPQMIERVSKRFGKDVAIYHSGLNDQEKYEQYIRIREGKTQIVVGTRSAVFMPFKNLGLIVLDEEHDPSYKQQSMPMYHALEVAKFRSQYHQCPLVLGSASPSLESYARALRGVYTLLELPQRINQSFPEYEIVDLQEALYRKQPFTITNQLKDAITKTLYKNEQVMLLLNRRGYMTILKEQSSGSVLMCPNCDVALNYHKQSNLIKCHICDYTLKSLPKGQDGNPLQYIGSGVGTQRLTEMLQDMFPKARICRMDADAVNKKNSHESILTAFNNHEFDIMVGTQMIAKGLDNENVTLVGIMNIDTSLAHEDYRSVEATFSLILQAAGRSGRGDKKGNVLIQTFNKDHYALNYALKQQYKHFFKQEMQYRKLANYPPYSFLISFVFFDQNEVKANQQAQTFLSLLPKGDYTVLGPAKIRRLSNQYRVRIILKGKDLDNMLRVSNNTLEAYRHIEKGGVRVDVNPLTLES